MKRRADTSSHVKFPCHELELLTTVLYHTETTKRPLLLDIEAIILCTRDPSSRDSRTIAR